MYKRVSEILILLNHSNRQFLHNHRLTRKEGLFHSSLLPLNEKKFFFHCTFLRTFTKKTSERPDRR